MAESITNSVMARRIKKGPEDCPMALGKGAFGGITEGCSPGGQTWKLCGREVKTGTDKFPRRLAGKERREIIITTFNRNKEEETEEMERGRQKGRERKPSKAHAFNQE